MIENINLSELEKNQDLNKYFLTAKLENINESCTYYQGDFYLDSFNYYPITEDFKSFDELFVRVNKDSISHYHTETFYKKLKDKLNNIKVSREQIGEFIGRVEKQNAMLKGDMAKLLNKNNMDTLTYERQVEAKIAWSRIIRKKLAKSGGVDEENILVAESGSVVQLTTDGIDVVDSTDVSNVFVDGLTVSSGGDVTLRDRRHLSEDGVVVAVVNVDRHSGKCLTEPDIIFRGFVYPPEAEALLDRARNAVRSAIEQGDHPDPDPEYLQGKIRKVLGRQLYRETRRRPVILPIVTEV